MKYKPETGEWKLRVKHFTKYGGVIEEEDSNAGDEQSENESIQSKAMKSSPNNLELNTSIKMVSPPNATMPIEYRPKQFSDFSLLKKKKLSVLK